MNLIKKQLIFISCICLIAFGCSKEDKPVAIYPGSYFPCYPNSWWEYQIINIDKEFEINDTTPDTWTTSSTYKAHSYGCSSSMSKIVFVPFLNGKPIYGYRKLQNSYAPYLNCDELWPILSETVGYKYRRSWTSSRYGDENEYLEVTQKTFDGTDSLIVVEGVWGTRGPNNHNRSYQVYKKGIGLTDHYIIKKSSRDTVYKRVLVDYSIGR